MFELKNIDQYKQNLLTVLQMYQKNPNAECEFRLGMLDRGEFSSRNLAPFALFEALKREKIKATERKYTVMTFEDGVRVSDGKPQRKEKLAHVDLDYLPIAARLSVAREITIAMPSQTVPTGTREMMRWSYIVKLPKSGPVELSISHVNSKGWEVEVEFMHTPKTTEDLIEPLRWVLERYLVGYDNVLPRQAILDVAGDFNQTWRQSPMDGLVRKTGYKPLNFTMADIEMIKTGDYATSNKLDGVKYNMVSHLDAVYIVNETDAQYVGVGDLMGEIYDGEWDPHSKELYIFDVKHTDGIDYSERVRLCEAAVKALALTNVKMKHILFGPTAKATRDIIQWMKKEYGAEWQERNDGIIYTPTKVGYLAQRERQYRTLKYKWPLKISVDLELELIKDTATEKIAKTFAADRTRNTEVRETRLTLDNKDPWFNWIYTGVIAEVGYWDGIYHIMRLRMDKTTPNFITVVLETLKDIHNPLSVEELLKRLSSKKSSGGGGAKHKKHNNEKEAKELESKEEKEEEKEEEKNEEPEKKDAIIPDVTDAELEAAQKYILQDRARFAPVYKLIMQYANDHQLIMSNPECFADSAAIPNIINLYSSNALKVATEIANKMYLELSKIIFLKTVIPYEEFEISILGRSVVKLLSYPRVRHIKTDKLFKSVPRTFDSMPVKLLSPDIELIEIYHRLYMPFPEKWEAAQELEQHLNSILHKEGGGRPHPKNNHKPANDGGDVRKIRDALYAALEFNDLGVLVGHWAYFEMYPDEDPRNEKIQLMNDFEPMLMQEKIDNVLRDITPFKTTHKTEELHIPHDLHIRRTTYYLQMGETRVALLDVFNSTEYEMVPYVLREHKIKIGNPYVLCRFFMIDRWILSVLNQGGFVNDDTLKNKSRILLVKTAQLRLEKDLVFKLDYVGVYKDFAIERRKVLKQEEKFRPYKPAEYFAQHGKLREL